jgi:hypothetical protein
MPELTLQGSSTMPALGLGTWKAATGDVGQAVRTALEQRLRTCRSNSRSALMSTGSSSSRHRWRR